ncbi:translocation/assembly module TamB domain-containing protein [Bartonella sp. B35(2025)]
MKKTVYLWIFLFSFFFLLMSVLFFVQRDNSSSSKAEMDNHSWFISFIERRLSAPNYQVRLHNVQGALSSQMSIDAITVSDRKGVWLKITNAKMDWNRLMLLKGCLDIDQLSAEQITFLRKPQSRSLISFIEAKKFSLPKLPIAIFINTLIAKHVVFEQDLLGFSADVSLKGYLTLANGNFEADIAAHRLDAPGNFSILTKVSNSSRMAKIDLAISEPQNGIIANILKIEKRPALNLAINGNGTFDDLIVKLYLAADHHTVLNGSVVLANISEEYTLSTKLVGTLGVLMPSQYRCLFESDVTLEAKVRMTKEGMTHFDHITIQNKAMNVVANAAITADGFLRQLFVNGKMVFEKEKESTHLSILEAPMHIDNLALTIDYGREGQKFWKGQFVVHNFRNKNVYIRDAIFDMGGVSENLDNVSSRHVGIQVKGILQGTTKTTGVLVEDLNQTIHVHLDTDVISRKPILIHNFNVTAQDFSAWLKGKIDRFVFKGNLGLDAKTLAPLSLLNGQSFSGSADIKARGTIGLISGSFDLDVLGMSQNMKIGVKSFDHLFKGNFFLSGGIARNTTGLVLRRLDLKNKYASVKADGYFSSESAKMDLFAQVSDLTILDPKINGALTVQSTARGHNNLITLNTRAYVAEAFLVGKKLQNATFIVNTLVDNTSPIATYLTGSIKGEGTFAQKPLHLAASFRDSNNIRELQDINIRGGNARITGNLSQTLEGLMKGTLHIDADDISVLAALFLQEGSGKVKGDFIFDKQDNKQKANLKVYVDHLSFAKNKIKKLTVEADIFDPFGMTQFEGFIDAKHIKTPFMMVNHLNVDASCNDGQTVFTIQTMLYNNINAQLAGRVITVGLSESIKQEIQIETLNVKQPNFHATLLQPTTIIFNKNGVAVSELGIAVNGGKVVLSGNFYDALNLHLTMNAFPVALVNLWKPNLKATGTLTGQVMIHGSLKEPNVIYDIKGEGLTTVALQDKKIVPLVLSSAGKTIDNILTLNADLTGEGIQAQAQGTVSLDKGKLDLHVNLQNLPAYLANSFIEKQALKGMVTGKIDIRGILKNPSVHFDLSSQNLTVTTHKGLASINMSARGVYEKSIFHIERIVANGHKELDLSVGGIVSLSNSGTKLNIKGIMPLAFFDPFLAERGAYVTGIAKIDAALNGTWFQPQLVGNFSVINGNFFDSKTNLELHNIEIESKLDGNRILIEKASASSSGGGSIFASGYITNNLQTDLIIDLDHANYNDGSMIFTTLSGKMTMTGYFLGDLVIGGNIIVEKAEIFVSDRFQNAQFLNIKNKNLTTSIQKTLEHADIKSYSQNRGVSKEFSSIIRLNMKITARNQFFVRGRGLDTELGGRINLTGSLHDVHPVGEFQMIRGRFDILSQRLNFDQGQASFSGNLNPTVYFVSNKNSGDIRITVTVSGNIDNLDINFSSQPSLPQDEVLARLTFNRSLNELSPFQIAQLAAVAADLAGASNISLLNTLRAKIGLDDLDVIFDEKGNTGLRIGRYIHNNIYLGFEAGSAGTTKGTINLDISRHLKAKGAIGNEKNFSIGLFYEKYY